MIETQRQLRPEHQLSKENGISQVIYAGRSVRRTAALQYVLPDVEVISIPGGDERDIADVALIAEEKVDHVEAVISTEAYRCAVNLGNITAVTELLSSEKNYYGLAVIAADTRTKTPSCQGRGDGVYDWFSKGKPGNSVQVYEHFESMDQAERMGKPPCYSVDTATTLRMYEPVKKKIREVDKVIVSLKSRAAYWLASCGGFETYLQAFRRFYDSDLYSSGHVCPTDISAGISLPVLTSLRVVDNINGISVDNPHFQQVYKESLYSVAVGMHPKVLNEINPEAGQRINEWGWLNEITERSLYGTATAF